MLILLMDTLLIAHYLDVKVLMQVCVLQRNPLSQAQFLLPAPQVPALARLIPYSAQDVLYECGLPLSGYMIFF